MLLQDKSKTGKLQPGLKSNQKLTAYSAKMWFGQQFGWLSG